MSINRALYNMSFQVLWTFSIILAVEFRTVWVFHVLCVYHCNSYQNVKYSALRLVNWASKYYELLLIIQTLWDLSICIHKWLAGILCHPLAITLWTEISNASTPAQTSSSGNERKKGSAVFYIQSVLWPYVVNGAGKSRRKHAPHVEYQSMPSHTANSQ